MRKYGQLLYYFFFPEYQSKNVSPESAYSNMAPICSYANIPKVQKKKLCCFFSIAKKLCFYDQILTITFVKFVKLIKRKNIIILNILIQKTCLKNSHCFDNVHYKIDNILKNTYLLLIILHPFFLRYVEINSYWYF